MTLKLPVSNRNPSRTDDEPGLNGLILRLVKSTSALHAIESGQVDAIMDPTTGNAILLPEAQKSLRDGEARFRSLVGLSSDGYWEQDEHFRFVSYLGAAIGGSRIDDEGIIGKTLWDVPFDNMSKADWQAHQRQLKSHVTFRDLELRRVDHAGKLRYISVSGEPIFDQEGRFKGYRGTMRDVTKRKQAEAGLQEPNRVARAILDALAADVCVLDAAGTVIMANKGWHAFAAANGGIGAGVTEGANYLAVCDKARGNERVDGIAIAAGIRQVIAGERTLFRHEYGRDSPAGRYWFILTVTGFSGDGAARAVISRENITEPLPELEYTAANRLPVANGLLAVLPRKEYQRLRASLEPVTLTYGEVLYEPREPIRHVYFPNNSLVSLLTTVEGHKALEVGLVGWEGMVGVPLALGSRVSSVRALVQGTGKAMRMKSARFLKEFQQSLSLQRELYRYSHLLTAQVTQTAACNRFHMVEARLARWLLMTRDRVRSDEFHLTHEFLANMLGVRRAGVTNAASALQQRKLISYSRGNISILDRKGLKAASCGCYQTVKDMFDSTQG